jgi:asparagine synthetase B (glutamine-hydrolysing)
MCGICYIFNWNNNHSNGYQSIKYVKVRGPDSFITKTIDNNNKQIIMHCSVLHFQGKNIQKQPIYDENLEMSSLLAWNGEVFISQFNQKEESDTLFVFNLISSIEKNSDWDQFTTKIVKFLESIGGPYSFIYYSSKFDVTLFGRDPIGRRSLLMGKNDDEIVITSVACSKDPMIFSEVTIDGIFYFDHSNYNQETKINLIPWIQRHNNHPLINKDYRYLPISDNKSFNLSLLSSTISYFNYQLNEQNDTPNQKLAKDYLFTLAKSVLRRISFDTRQGDRKTQPIMILFSGGIDSTILTALSHILLSNNDDELKIPFELVNVSSGKNPSESPDRIASIFAFNEIKKLPYAEKRDFRLIFVDINEEDIKRNEKRIYDLIYPKDTIMDFNIGTALWFASQQYEKLSTICENNNDLNEIISYFSSRSVPQLKQIQDETEKNSTEQLDMLLEIIFKEIITQEKIIYNENDGLYYVLLSSLHNEQLQEEKKKYNCKSLLDLINKCRKERFIKTLKSNDTIAVTIIKEEYIAKINKEMERKKQILFKLRADYGREYKTQGKVVILGMGADESLGGYSRYKTQDFSSEMQKDFVGLWKKNLGRDDRIISDSGREARFPFLDEDILSLLSFCNNSKDIFDFSKPIGIGDKMLLRTCARMIGLYNTSFLAKRAIQFGTRIANRKNEGASTIKIN